MFENSPVTSSGPGLLFKGKKIFNLFYLFIFGCIGLLLLCVGFLQLWWVGATLGYGAQASHCGGSSLLLSMGSRCVGFSSCSMQAPCLWLGGPRAQPPWLCHMCLVALQHVGSSQTRARTCVPCIGRQILNHCATREALLEDFNYSFNFITCDWYVHIF